MNTGSEVLPTVLGPTKCCIHLPAWVSRKTFKSRKWAVFGDRHISGALKYPAINFALP